MGVAEIVAIIALVLSLLLLIRVISLQIQLNSLRFDLERLEGRPETSALPKTSEPASAPLKIPRPSNYPDIDSRLRTLIAEGKRIQAIKMYRNARQVSLVEAKDYVDDLERR